MEQMRVEGHIHSLSAVVARDQEVVWHRVFGDTSRIGDTTMFYLASLTKPMAGTIVLQLVDEGKVSLDDPVAKYGIALTGPDTIRIRHLLSHTSEGIPGSHYSYSGARYSLLDSVIVRMTGKSFAAALAERIIKPLGLRHTSPTPQSDRFAATGFDRAAYAANLAQGYVWKNGELATMPYRTSFSSAAGVTSSALDYAAFAMAMDRDLFLKPATKALAFSPVIGPNGEKFPYGLGWFTTEFKGAPVIWHYGYWDAASALVIKVPSQKLTFVLLANTDGLSSPYPLGSGKLDVSPWAREFLERFVMAK
jgi:CubicO group peptidase (beta-lactamase class C family)